MLGLSQLALMSFHCLLRVGNMHLLGILSRKAGMAIQKCTALELTCLSASSLMLKHSANGHACPSIQCTAYKQLS